MQDKLTFIKDSTWSKKERKVITQVIYLKEYIIQQGSVQQTPKN
jgi:hypothetical protein